MKRHVLTTTMLLLTLSGGIASESFASSVPLAPTDPSVTVEDATPGLKQNASRDRQRQQEAARRERERQRQAELQERWRNDRDDDDDDDRQNDDWWSDRNRDRWDDQEDDWDDEDNQRDRDRRDWEQERNRQDWNQRQNWRYWEDQRQNWDNRQRDWEFRQNWWQNNQQSAYPYGDEGIRLELTSLSQEWTTVSIQSVNGEQELSFAGNNTQQAIYLTPGAYRLRFRPTLSNRFWRSGYLNVGQTPSLRIVFDQNRDIVQIYDDPSAWVAE